MGTKVLIAEDDENMLACLEYLMQHEGYEVLLAHDGNETLELVHRHQPDLLILNIIMPIKNGFEVCQEVRNHSLHAGYQPKILMLTAKNRETDVAKGLALGANAYMTKPFGIAELSQRVRTLLETAPS
jgi:DNA-binding response OmpR family regulator